jgi:hypothetical protein
MHPTPMTPRSTRETPSTGKKAARLAPGALRGMVEDYLCDHPGEQFGFTAIANALGGKSSGAVSNALDKLVEDGVATKTQDKPRRFAIAPIRAGCRATLKTCDMAKVVVSQRDRLGHNTSRPYNSPVGSAPRYVDGRVCLATTPGRRTALGRRG